MNTRQSLSLCRRLGFAFALAALFVSCSGHIGYGVLNWSIPEQNLVAGDIVPVFIESHIGNVYVIGVEKKRVEVPLWQITLYKSRSKAKRAADARADYRYAYATVKLDGLPMRADPDNTARQVYRLKQGEKIKILKKGEGVPVLVGNSPLAGDWFQAMTDDGSIGWCFSYNLDVFDERESDGSTAVAEQTGPDAVLQNLLSRAWYPDLYRTMIEDNRVDIDRINVAWGFFPGNDAGVARIENENGVVTFPYTSIARGDDGKYAFVGSSLTVRVRRSDSILVEYTDATGMPQALYFASIGTTPADLVASEKERRAEVLAGIVSAGPGFTSGNYGVLRFLSGGSFVWSGYQLLSPTAIPASAGGGGKVSLPYFLSADIARDYDGALTFTFDQAPSRVTFLYKLTDKGLRLEYVSESNVKDSVVQSRNLNPVIAFFSPDKGAS